MNFSVIRCLIFCHLRRERQSIRTTVATVTQTLVTKMNILFSF